RDRSNQRLEIIVRETAARNCVAPVKYNPITMSSSSNSSSSSSSSSSSISSTKQP
ncbi:hypothetical protein K0M31_008945, partial [Melipona bicolor]